MFHHLSELGDLRTGFQLRGAAKHEAGAAIPIIQLGDVREEDIQLDHLIRMNLERVRERDFLNAGDILLRGRGASYGAAVVPDYPTGTVATAPLYVLRPDRSIVLPEYLVWYLNRPSTQAILAAQARGTYIPTVSIQAFADLEVVVPPLAVQRQIAETSQLLREERELTLQLLDKQEQLTQALLEKTLQQSLR